MMYKGNEHDGGRGHHTCHGQNFSLFVFPLFPFSFFIFSCFLFFLGVQTDLLLLILQLNSVHQEKPVTIAHIREVQKEQQGIYHASRACSSAKSDEEGLGVPSTKGGLSGLGILMG